MKTVSCENGSVTPNKVICIGRNYVEHIEELGNELSKEMVIFFKPNSSIGDEIFACKEELCQFEGEICFLVNNNKLAYVGFGLDLTKRDVQSRLKSKGLPWERAKAFKNAALFSKFVSFSELGELSMELHVNNKLAQKGGVDLMIHKLECMIDEILSFSDVDENDIIMSGTPKGVGEYKKGDVLVGRVFEKNNLLVEKRWVVI